MRHCGDHQRPLGPCIRCFPLLVSPGPRRIYLVLRDEPRAHDARRERRHGHVVHRGRPERVYSSTSALRCPPRARRLCCCPRPPSIAQPAVPGHRIQSARWSLFPVSRSFTPVGFDDAIPDHTAAWARDEPPSPDEASSAHYSERRPSAAASHASIGHHSRLDAPSPWWAFTLPRNQPSLAPPQLSQGEKAASRETESPKLPRTRLSFRDRSMSWLHTSHLRRQMDLEQTSRNPEINDQSHDWNIQMTVPEPQSPFTLSHSRTPGWDTPWAPKAPAANTRQPSNYFGIPDTPVLDADEWTPRERRLRSYILNHHHVPLVRIIDSSPTSFG